MQDAGGIVVPMLDPRAHARGAVSALAAASFALVLGVVLSPSDVEACGGFFSRTLEAGRKPSLAYEQVLIVHDPSKDKEHFVSASCGRITVASAYVTRTVFA